jgi:hypothetical protein
LRSVPRTKTFTKAPVSFSSSHGAVVSQARSWTITSFHRADWPGWRATYWTMPLRLLRIPSTATRCGMGVTPAWLADAAMRFAAGVA